METVSPGYVKIYLLRAIIKNTGQMYSWKAGDASFLDEFFGNEEIFILPPTTTTSNGSECEVESYVNLENGDLTEEMINGEIFFKFSSNNSNERKKG